MNVNINLSYVERNYVRLELNFGVELWNWGFLLCVVGIDCVIFEL